MAKPIFCIAHPRACSTAFERVFMTRTEDMACVHEPFGDAFYFGPERMGGRYEHDEAARVKSGFDNSTYKTILDRIESEGSEGKRLFVKDISYYFVPPYGAEAQIAPSLLSKKRGIGTGSGAAGRDSSQKSAAAPFPYGTEAEPGNPTIIPMEILKRFHFTFLIRDPHNSIPSYYRCTIPPLDDMTGFYNFDPVEAGYVEQRQILDAFVACGLVGPKRAGQVVTDTNNHAISTNGHANGTNGVANGINGTMESAGDKAKQGGTELCVVDADDLLDDPEGIVSEYCRSVGLEYDPSMLVWDTEESHRQAKEAFEKWRGFHEDAIESKDLKPRPAHRKKQKSEADWDAEWEAKYGAEGAKIIRATVDANMEHYRYMKQFAMKV